MLTRCKYLHLLVTILKLLRMCMSMFFVYFSFCLVLIFFFFLILIFVTKLSHAMESYLLGFLSNLHLYFNFRENYSFFTVGDLQWSAQQQLNLYVKGQLDIDLRYFKNNTV